MYDFRPHPETSFLSGCLPPSPAKGKVNPAALRRRGKSLQSGHGYHRGRFVKFFGFTFPGAGDIMRGPERRGTNVLSRAGRSRPARTVNFSPYDSHSETWRAEGGTRLPRDTDPQAAKRTPHASGAGPDKHTRGTNNAERWRGGAPGAGSLWRRGRSPAGAPAPNFILTTGLFCGIMLSSPRKENVVLSSFGCLSRLARTRVIYTSHYTKCAFCVLPSRRTRSGRFLCRLLHKTPILYRSPPAAAGRICWGGGEANGWCTRCRHCARVARFVARKPAYANVGSCKYRMAL